jgi:hypothetical protein
MRSKKISSLRRSNFHSSARLLFHNFQPSLPDQLFITWGRGQLPTGHHHGEDGGQLPKTMET